MAQLARLATQSAKASEAPYCEERQIARVARSYGIRVTDSQVRNNPNTKVWLCQTIGNDNRLKGSCGAYSERAYPW